MRFKINDLEEGLNIINKVFSEYKEKSKIFLFRGDLGTGKTTYISSIIKDMKDEKYVNSPTYTIINSYMKDDPIVYHADLYRLEDEEDVFETGLVDMLEEEAFFFIEWPDRFLDIFKNFNYVLIDIKNNENKHERELEIIENIIC